MSKGKKIGLIVGSIIGGLVIIFLIISFILNQLGLTTGSYETMDKSSRNYSVGAAPMAMMQKSMSGAEKMDMDEAYYEESNINDNSDSTQERLIIKTGNISMIVKDVKVGIQEIVKYAENNDGFVVSSNIEEDDYDMAPSGRVTIRIPSKNFDEGINKTKELSIKVVSESVNGQDVTEEYVDLNARLGNLQATEKQFLEIMQKAYKITDILAVQRELSNVRGEIERLQGRMKYLKQSADLSTITVYLSTDESQLPVVDEDDQWKPVVVIKNAVRSLLDFGKGLVNLIIWLVIYIPLWLVIWLVVHFVRRYFKKKKALKME